MYVITVNTLDTLQQKYTIDDPRYFYTENLNGTNENAQLTTPTSPNISVANNWCERAQSLYYVGTTQRRRLRWYYPTNESDDYAYVIAPKIRVASSYGKTNPQNRRNSRRRCATYQEAGYPAGRWRLPTLGEMQYIVNLSNTGKIPVLFSNSRTYLSAQGWVSIPAASTSDITLTANDDTQSAYVRCVYDEWYWEKQTDYTITPTTGYRLGDMPKNNPEEGIK